jgi:GNAT superfamily N-acetyltransferase
LADDVCNAWVGRCKHEVDGTQGKEQLMGYCSLAVSQAAQGQGIGVDLMQDSIRRTLNIAEQVGIRAMLTHPIDKEAARIYQNFGFKASPLRPDQLLILLKDVRRWVQRSFLLNTNLPIAL